MPLFFNETLILKGFIPAEIWSIMSVGGEC